MEEQRVVMDRAMYTFVVSFLLSGQSLGKLLAQRRLEEAKAVSQMIRDDAPLGLAQTDPALYRRLRDRITELRIGGY